MQVGRLAHERIQEHLEPRDIGPDIIPKRFADSGEHASLDFQNAPRPDLLAVWDASEARARGLSFKKRPHTPFVIAEIGEIKPRSYSRGGIRHSAALSQIDKYMNAWNKFSDIPAIRMKSVTWGFIGEFLNTNGLIYRKDVDGLIIYSCPLDRDEFDPVPFTRRAQKEKLSNSEKVDEGPQSVVDRIRNAARENTAAFEILANFITRTARLRSLRDQAAAAAKFVVENAGIVAAIAALAALVAAGIAFGPALLVALAIPASAGALSVLALLTESAGTNAVATV
jgi:hypothetical protein